MAGVFVTASSLPLSPIQKMPKVHLIEGPAGAGKSTYAYSYAMNNQGVHIALDTWFSVLFNADRMDAGLDPEWYVARKERLTQLIWDHSRQLLANGVDVILELGLVQRSAREVFFRQVESDGFEIQMHVLDAPCEVRRARVWRRSREMGRALSPTAWEEIFEMDSKLWEPLDAAECEQYQAVFVSGAK